MSQSKYESQEWGLPRLKETLQLDPSVVHQPYDVKFYPFGAASADPIFAVVSALHILVYRICREKGHAVQLIRKIKDNKEDVVFHSLVWTKDVETGVPLVCAAGSSAKIEIFDVRKGELRRTFIGHGGDINDLAISPTNPHILASASADNTIRLWNLDPAHRKAPCVVVYAGEGHKDTVLSISFHASGRYLLSSGQDHVINLWIVPELSADVMEAAVIHYPLFSTSEVHSDIVDCVSFYGDLVLSKASQERCIVLWRITGFDSSLPTPASSCATPNAINKHGTSSAFLPASQPSGPRQYLRLLQFSTPKCEQFYMRFSLSSPRFSQAAHPTLAICNSVSQVFFWDFARFEECHRCVKYPKNLSNEGDGFHRQPPPPPWLAPACKAEKRRSGLDWRRTTEPSNTDSTGTSISLHTTSTDTLPGNTSEIPEGLKRKYEVGSPLGMVEAHWKETMTKSKHVVGRQVAWSACGRWCVAVAEPNLISILEKWGQGEASRG